VVAVRRDINATAEAVWKVLADGWLYPSWVVGASRMRDVDSAWPRVGASLHHSIGSWPLLLDDTTTVLACVPQQELVLRARAWPAGEADVTLLLAGRDGACEIVMAEEATGRPGRLLPASVQGALLAPRNSESLRRLAYIAEGRSR
jgi:uncharacterized protein YndB with AHSA1/START domain